MGRSFIVMSLLFTGITQANEVARINALVDEVKQLRINYDQCQAKVLKLTQAQYGDIDETKLKECTVALDDQKQKNNLLLKEIDQNTLKIKEQNNEIESLKTQIEHYKSALKEQKSKNQTIQTKVEILKKEVEKLKKELAVQKEKKPLHVTAQECTKPAPQKIIVKVKEEKSSLALDDEHRVVVKKEQKIEITEPKTYRTKVDAKIYDAPNGKVIDEWEKGRSFTSYIASNGWVRITGYFVDRVWTEAPQELWIKSTDAFERKPKK